MLSYHKTDNVEDEIKQAIEEALILAKDTLKREMKLLLAMSDYLSDNRMLEKEDIKDYIIKYSTGLSKIEESKGDVFYRKHLKMKIGEICSNSDKLLLPAIMLNKQNTK